MRTKESIKDEIKHRKEMRASSYADIRRNHTIINALYWVLGAEPFGSRDLVE